MLMYYKVPPAQACVFKTIICQLMTESYKNLGLLKSSAQNTDKY